MRCLKPPIWVFALLRRSKVLRLLKKLVSRHRVNSIRGISRNTALEVRNGAVGGANGFRSWSKRSRL